MEATLRSSKNDGLFEILDHEGKTAGCKTHGVSSVNYDECVKIYLISDVPS